MTDNAIRDAMLSAAIPDQVARDLTTPGIPPVDPTISHLIAMIQQSIETAGSSLDTAQRGLATLLTLIHQERASDANHPFTCPHCSSADTVDVTTMGQSTTRLCADCGTTWET